MTKYGAEDRGVENSDCGIDCGTKRRDAVGGERKRVWDGQPAKLVLGAGAAEESLRFGSGGLELARLKLIAWIWVDETQTEYWIVDSGL